jgi:tetratricopeptide (TPR) repeat protein
MVLIVGGAAGLLVIAFLWWWIAGSTMRRFGDALEKGRLAGTDGQSAYELYSQALREKGPTSSTIQAMREEARPFVRRRVEELFQRWYQDSDLGEGTRWVDLKNLSAWLAEIDSADGETLARAKFAQGQTELLANHFADSEQLFRTSLNYKPNWPLSLNAIGRACRNERNYQCAEDYYRRAVQADPQWIFPHQNLAGLFMEQNRLAESEAEYQAAVRLNPNRPGSRFLLGQLYDRRRQPAEACAEYRAALSLAANQARASFDREFVNRRIQKVCK